VAGMAAAGMVVVVVVVAETANTLLLHPLVAMEGVQVPRINIQGKRKEPALFDLIPTPHCLIQFLCVVVEKRHQGWIPFPFSSFTQMEIVPSLTACKGSFISEWNWELGIGTLAQL